MILSTDQYRNIGKNALMAYHAEIVKAGTQISFKQFIAHIDKLNPFYLKLLGESIQIYGDNGYVYDVFRELGKRSNGLIPVARIDLQIFIQALKDDVDDINISKLARWTGESVVELANSFSIFAPLALVGGIVLFMFINANAKARVKAK